jgi:hypothetical protein
VNWKLKEIKKMEETRAALNPGCKVGGERVYCAAQVKTELFFSFIRLDRDP